MECYTFFVSLEKEFTFGIQFIITSKKYNANSKLKNNIMLQKYRYFYNILPVFLLSAFLLAACGATKKTTRDKKKKSEGDPFTMTIGDMPVELNNEGKVKHKEGRDLLPEEEERLARMTLRIEELRKKELEARTKVYQRGKITRWDRWRSRRREIKTLKIMKQMKRYNEKITYQRQEDRKLRREMKRKKRKANRRARRRMRGYK